uniref:Uncharacterized protein n=1 Tax=Romanomermis culicivorax TaxID=13658 RepID=A0A915JB84_ROMCU
MKTSENEDKDEVSNSATPVTVRRKFPETWIFHDIEMRSVQLCTIEEEIDDETTDQETPTSLSFTDVEESASEKDVEFYVRQRFPETWIWFGVLNEEWAKAVICFSQLRCYCLQLLKCQVSEKDHSKDILSLFASLFLKRGYGYEYFYHNQRNQNKVWHKRTISQCSVTLEVFRPFFIRLNLPYSVKRGEKLALQVLLFNYMDADQMTTVTLDHNENSPFDLIQKPGDAKNKQASQKDSMRIINVGLRPSQRYVPAGGSTSVFFPMMPTKVGDLKLLVKAIGGKSSDAVENVLIVEAEGYPIFKNKPFIIDLTSNNTWKNKIQMNFPANAIPGSQKASVTFVGDIMGPILDNIEKLIQMPYGCGEQNMLNFVPNIVVTRYLTSTNRLTPVLKEKTKKYMESGAQRELTYQRDDASYSAFGKSDKAGSTWLTAFVSQQKENGAFTENGEVHHKSMQGGAAAGGAALTAYVFLSLIENNVTNVDAQKFLERSLELIGDDTYALAVITYALHLSQSSRKDDAFKILVGRAVSKDGLMYWKKAESKMDDIKTPYWYDKPPPAEVEMTSYALLTYLLRGDVSGALPLVRWLVGQQNAQGGFSSTQSVCIRFSKYHSSEKDFVAKYSLYVEDNALYSAPKTVRDKDEITFTATDTVVGLEALGAYAAKSYSPNVGAKLTSRNGDQKHTFDVTVDNAIVQQQLDLKNYDQPVELDAQGKGVSFGQVNWHYNLPQLSDDQPFSCDKKVQQNSANEVLVNLCCKYALSGRSNMALMEVESPSGFIVDQEKLNQLTKIKNLQRVETDQGETKANIYFNSIGNDSICLNVTSQRVFSVADQKPSLVKLSDYYAPEKQPYYARYQLKSILKLQMQREIESFLDVYLLENARIRFDYSVAKKLSIDEVCGGDCWRDDSGKTVTNTGVHSAKEPAFEFALPDTVILFDNITTEGRFKIDTQAALFVGVGMSGNMKGPPYIKDLCKYGCDQLERFELSPDDRSITNQPFLYQLARYEVIAVDMT